MYAHRLNADPCGSHSSLLSALFESMPEPLLLCNSDLLVIGANAAAKNLLSASVNELAGKSAADLLPTPPPPHAELSWRSEFVRRGKPYLLDVSGTAIRDGNTQVEGWLLKLKSCHGEGPPKFVGFSPVTQELLEFVSRIARTRASAILLQGESGTGKDLIAKRIHALSPRASAPFVAIQCAALPEGLCESELFGYEKGAFTNAAQANEGLFEHAHGGTVFLDEIAELPLSMQAKLLRVLEDHSFRRIGGTRKISVDVRVVSATNQDLEQAMAEGRFRSDLYYRLNCVQIRLPALRERAEDIESLAHHFIDQFNKAHNRHVRGIHPAARRMLEVHAWPGNVRELRNTIERAVLVETSPWITPSSLKIFKRAENHRPMAPTPLIPDRPAPFCLRGSERELITAVLAETAGNQVRAASLLGIGRFSLRYKMKKLGLL